MKGSVRHWGIGALIQYSSVLTPHWVNAQGRGAWIQWGGEAVGHCDSGALKQWGIGAVEQ
jgi:hypothetical protein